MLRKTDRGDVLNNSTSFTSPIMHPTLKLISTSGLLLGLGAGSFFLAFGAALKQEADTTAVFRAIGQSHLTGNPIVPIQAGQDRWIVRDLNGLNQLMQQRGFSVDDRAGGLIPYSSSTQRQTVSCGMFSRFYMICEADQATPL
jgi:hypothetical protein